ncbi:MAG TPA: hypothetical protein VFJ90_01570, partial [Candidatus Didemnitutus sp.]|nr:hypothetical protein [Candidatus Didemnitutus sp.]
MTKRLLFLAGYGALGVALALAGFWLLFTAFKTYDDEGYVLLSLANFSRDGGLYTKVYSQYGPFFYLFNDALHRLLGYDFSNTSARLMTLACWLGAALSLSHLVWRQTKQAGWALLALAATFAQLWQMAAEPGHPGGLLALILALAAWLGGNAIAQDRPCLLAIASGLAGAALALTKINVGGLFLVGAVSWLLLHSADVRLARVAPWLVALMLGVLPWGLMHALIAQDWVQSFALIASASLLATLLASLPARRAWFTRNGWGWFVASGLALSSVVVAVVIARGTNVDALLEGTVIGPARHPGVYFFAVNWRPGATLVAVVSLALAVATAVFRGTERPWFPVVVASVRLGLFGWTAMAWLGAHSLNSLALVMSYGLSLTWLLVIPLSRADSGLATGRVRSWLGLLAALQALHAYPVGGSQIGWGTFLWVPLLLLATAEATAWLIERSRVARLISPVAGAVAAVLAGLYANAGWEYWRSSEPLRLPGAESLRLPEPLGAGLRALALNASVHADTLFSLPGTFSFNLWTGRPTPTAANVTHWFSLLTAEQQAQAIARLEADPHACIIVERELLAFLHQSHLDPAGPLRDYLYAQFTPAFAASNYEFWVKRGRTVAPLSTAALLRHAQTGE